MRNQNSIFEPLFSQVEEVHTTPSLHLSPPHSSEWLTSTCSPPACVVVDQAFCNSYPLKKAATTIFNEDNLGTNRGHIEHDHHGGTVPKSLLHELRAEAILLDAHGKPTSSCSDPMAGSIPIVPPSPSRSLSLGSVDRHGDDDDGSVASRLLGSITKSISSPSLPSYYKESARETPYQKSLKLKTMKLQHCAEELGSESSDGAPVCGHGGYSSSFDDLYMMSSSDCSLQLVGTSSSFARSSSSTLIPQREQDSDCDGSPAMISVRSAPNLMRCSSLSSRHTRERAFPPPLSHTLPRSASSDSFALSLRAYREEGRFMLKEVKVPCRQYLQANRKDGRLTLQLYMADEDVEQEDSAQKELRQDEIEVDKICKGIGDTDASHDNEVMACGFSENVEAESGKTIGAVGDSETIETGKSIDVFKDEIETKAIGMATYGLREDGVSSAAESLLIAITNDNCNGKTNDATHSDASCIQKLNFNGICQWKPCLYSSQNCKALLPGNGPKLKVRPVTRFPQCEERLALRSRSNWRASHRFKISPPAGLEGGGFPVDRSLAASSTMIIFKDVGAKSLMENVTKLVSSFGLEGGGKWGQGQQAKKSLREAERSGSKKKNATELKDITSKCNYGIPNINTGVSKVERNGALATMGRVCILDAKCEHEAPLLPQLHPQQHIELRKEEEDRWVGMNGMGASAKRPFNILHMDVQVSLHLDWVHSLHCKELSDRNQFATKGFPCVAIRS